MLNLVQLQERLKDVPMQALMQYANGANPQIPPFLALGELNRRKKMQEGAAADQAREMEGAPTVKQQIEQAAGLMALQGNRQRQAAQQQATLQSALPMAAPNTTTSEPAQLAGGGFIDDIVVPRDYQRGGMVNPEMLKRLMMMKAMKRPGVTGLPMRPDMFKRGDYAGGGIVAFQDGGSTFAGFEGATSDYEEPKKKRETATKEQIAAMTLPELQEYYRSGTIPDRVRAPTQRPAQVSPTATPPTVTPPAAAPSAQDAPTRGAGLPSITEAARTYLSIDPKTALPELARKRPEVYARDLDEFSKAFGVSGDPFKDLKRRLGEVEAEDKRTRADQPMDQLARLLTSISTGPRGGTLGTQAAVGAKASSQLRAEQIALNRKQDLDMAALQGAIAEKEDAIARGDRDRAMAADQKIADYNNNLAKDRLAIMQNQAQTANQAEQARANVIAAGRPSALMEEFGLFKRDPTGYEGFRRARGFGDESLSLRLQQNVDRALREDPQYMDYRLLLLNPTPENKRKAEEIRAKAYADAGIPRAATAGSGGQRIRLDEKGNIIP